MTRPPEHIRASVSHTRRGALSHAFRYSVDYVLIDPDARSGPLLFSRNRFNLASVHDKDHGGAPKAGRGADWARAIFAQRGVNNADILLLTQPRFLSYVFNPVSFWMAIKDEALLAVIAEVTNTYNDRHSYFCIKPDRTPIDLRDRIKVEKVMHVSPFLEVSGNYTFQFDIRPDNINLCIDFRDGEAGLLASLSGPRTPLSNSLILTSFLRRPVGALRSLVLIYWQALRLKLKGARFRKRPMPPNQEVS